MTTISRVIGADNPPAGEVDVLVWRVRALPVAHGRAYPSSAMLADGYHDGMAVTVACDWRAAWRIQQALADAGGEPVVCTAPSWALRMVIDA